MFVFCFKSWLFVSFNNDESNRETNFDGNIGSSRMYNEKLSDDKPRYWACKSSIKRTVES